MLKYKNKHFNSTVNKKSKIAFNIKSIIMYQFR